MTPDIEDGTETQPGQILYAPKTTLRSREHLPPEPFTGVYGPNPRPPVDWSPWEDLEWWKIDRIELALAYPPLETTPPGPLEHTLTITGVKTLRDQGSETFQNQGGAHVVTCVLDNDTSTEYVAKIYDGVDYPLGSREEGCLDCMLLADRDYSIEAWAYRTMQPLIGGTVVPSYFGSWTFALDTGCRDQPQRWVRMIPMELIQGECMLDMITQAETNAGRNVDYGQLPPEDFRVRVLRSIIESKLNLWWLGRVTHDDLEPRNIMVKPDGTVVIIDFNQSYIYDFTAQHDQHPRMLDPTRLPPSPVEWWWPIPCGFADAVKDGGRWGHWVPQRWLQNKVLAAEWLVETYGSNVRFARPSEWWLNRGYHASDGEKVLRLLESLGRKPVVPSSQAQG
jgi:hypothetical protein